MSSKSMVIVVQYEERSEEDVESFIESITATIEAEHGKIRSVYKDLEEKIASSLEKILDLTK